VSIPKFRNPDLYPEYPWRKWLRGELKAMPFNDHGHLIVEDIDLATIVYGGVIGRYPSEDGLLKLIEVKQLNGRMSFGQVRLYSMLDRLLRKGDPAKELYEGFFIVHWEPPARCRVNGQRVNMDELEEFFRYKTGIEPIDGYNLVELYNKGQLAGYM